MSVTIKKVSSSAELKKFIRFNYELYKENPFSVPDLYDAITQDHIRGYLESRLNDEDDPLRFLKLGMALPYHNE